MTWEANGQGGFRQEWVSPMEPCWARTPDAIPLTPDQIRGENRRNSLTRRAEQAMLAEGIQNTRRHSGRAGDLRPEPGCCVHHRVLSESERG
jgi:hypothetical protein